VPSLPAESPAHTYASAVGQKSPSGEPLAQTTALAMHHAMAAIGDISSSMGRSLPRLGKCVGSKPKVRIALTIHFAFIAFVLETSCALRPA
jgi:hypothetical protein